MWVVFVNKKIMIKIKNRKEKKMKWKREQKGNCRGEKGEEVMELKE